MRQFELTTSEGMLFKLTHVAALWLVLASVQSSDTEENVFLVRNLDGSQGLCTLNANIAIASDSGMQFDFESNICSEMHTFHFFMANDSRAITEVRLYRNSSADLIQYEAPYIVNSSRRLDLNQTLTIASTSKGQLSVNSTFLPFNVTKYNLAVLMTDNSDPVCSNYLSYYYLVNAPISLPDLMVLDKYKVIGLNQ